MNETRTLQPCPKRADDTCWRGCTTCGGSGTVPAYDVHRPAVSVREEPHANGYLTLHVDVVPAGWKVAA